MRKLSQSRLFGREGAIASSILAMGLLIGLTNPAFAGTSTAKTQMKGEALKAVFFETTMVGEYRLYRNETETYITQSCIAKTAQRNILKATKLKKAFGSSSAMIRFATDILEAITIRKPIVSSCSMLMAVITNSLCDNESIGTAQLGPVVFARHSKR